MAQELTHTRTGNTLRHAQSGLPSGLYQILIPAGTHLWRTGVQTYLSDEPASALASFDAPPTGPGEPCGPDTRNTLQRLWAGATLAFERPARSGTLMISQPESTSVFRADRDRWLYLQLNFPAGKALGWQSQIVLGEIPKPAPPAIDPALYARAHSLVEKVGLVQSMYRLSGCTNNDDFDKKVIESGVWPGLIEMVRLAGDGEVR